MLLHADLSIRLQYSHQIKLFIDDGINSKICLDIKKDILWSVCNKLSYESIIIRSHHDYENVVHELEKPNVKKIGPQG